MLHNPRINADVPRPFPAILRWVVSIIHFELNFHYCARRLCARSLPCAAAAWRFGSQMVAVLVWLGALLLFFPLSKSKTLLQEVGLWILTSLPATGRYLNRSYEMLTLRVVSNKSSSAKLSALLIPPRLSLVSPSSCPGRWSGLKPPSRLGSPG